MRVLLGADAAVEPTDEPMGTELMLVGVTGHESAVRLLLESKAAVDLKNNAGNPALVHASAYGKETLVRLLLKAGAAVDLKGAHNSSALSHASAGGHEGTMRLLLAAKAMVDSVDHSDATALGYASSRGHEGAMLVLLGAGAAVDFTDSNGRTALLRASHAGEAGAVRLLLESGAAVDLTDNNWVSALAVASVHGKEGVVRELLGAGAAVDSKDTFGRTPMMLASLHGQGAAVSALLEAGAAVNLKDSHGFTALRYANQRGNSDTVRALREAGASLGHQVPQMVRSLPPAPPPSASLQLWLILTLGAALALGMLFAWLCFTRPSRTKNCASERRPRVKGRGGGVSLTSAAGSHAASDSVRRQRVVSFATHQVGREAVAGALSVEEKASAESRQAKAKRKKQSQKTKRAETGPSEGGAHSRPAPLGANLPSQCSGSQTTAIAMGIEEGQRAVAEEDSGGGLCEDGGGISAGAGRRASTTLDPHPPVVSVPAGEVLRALETAGSDGEVGEGGFGKVFAAELPSMAARWGRVAIKRASGQLAADILLEVEMLRLCRHRNVLALLGYCDDARALCMITPLMHGGSLDDRLLLSDGAFERLRRLGFEGVASLDWRQRLSALCDAARGLAHLHGERILHRDVKTANILLEGALRPLPISHGPPLVVYRAVLSDVGLAKVRKPTLSGATTHATTRNLAFSIGFGDPALLNSNQHSEKTDAFGIGVCILMGLVSEPAAGLMKDREKDVCEAYEDGTGPLFGTAHAVADWPSDATRVLAAVAHGLSIAQHWKRQPLPEALAQMEALLGAVDEVSVGEVAKTQPAPAMIGAVPAVSRRLVSPHGARVNPTEKTVFRAVASATFEGSSGGDLTRMVRQLELGDADAPLARMRERVTKAYDSMMVRLERAHAGQGHAPLLVGETELRKIDLLAPRRLGPLNGLAHTLRRWWNAAKHERDHWTNPPSDEEVRQLVRDVIAELDGLCW